MNISGIKKYVRTNLRNVRTIADVARRFCRSPETLRRAFRRATGQSLAAFIRHEKLRAVERKLVTTRDRCFEIVYSVGFRREDSAARTFRRITGVTMEQYRQKYGCPRKRIRTGAGTR